MYFVQRARPEAGEPSRKSKTPKPLKVQDVSLRTAVRSEVQKAFNLSSFNSSANQTISEVLII